MKQIKELDISLYLEFYGNMLTANQKNILTMYFDLDYSLSEIAENMHISRQGVLDTIKHGKAKLLEFESAFGLKKKYEVTEQSLAEIEANVQSLNGDTSFINTAIQKIREAWEG